MRLLRTLSFLKQKPYFFTNPGRPSSARFLKFQRGADGRLGIPLLQILDGLQTVAFAAVSPVTASV